ncbi:type II toxin-antitoxin system HicA family toxin [uncultured Anaerococcus sp.]|uniref:type II toxin-antitoxin system HicA family toxin n=1 Tax=uncultured Anaerococcus sp. TaxID=293428 RepID=UPI00288A3F5E|nr:type II toxin-antitoxin system HicA family toxin [uncultured Anaerococcus sp.]
MNRKKLVRYIESNGAIFVRNGSNHDIYRLRNKTTSIPRHNEINELTAKIILKQLGIKS